MKLTGEVDKLENVGDAVAVSLINIRAKTDAAWRDCGPTLTLRMPFSRAAKYQIGRTVKITIQAA